MTNLDTTRFDGLSEAEILRRIGAILAAAIIRSGRLRSKNEKARAGRGDDPAPKVDPLRLIADPMARQIAEYLRYTGTASPVELQCALGLRPRSVTRALAQLRRGGVCEVVGRTRAVRYQLRGNFAQN
jgi:DNA-binding transcriptional ArsR family regulator